MFTRIDHVMICVPDLQQGMEQYRKLGFNISMGGAHPGKGTHNAIAFNNEDYLELLAIRDPGEHQAAASQPGQADAGLADFIAAGGGIRYIILQSDDLTADVAAMRSRGVDVSDATDGSRRTPAGQVLRWKFAVPGPKNPLPIFFIQHLTPLEERRKAAGAAGDQPNGVYTLERAY
ncbi:MAG TPA: VOC family protein, partial [Burkholderiales bacterium]